MMASAEPILTRIFHRVSTAAAQSGMPTALRLFGRLDILSNMPSLPARRAPCSHARLRPLVTKPYEISRLMVLAITAFFGVSAVNAGDSLLYFEAQGIAGYSSMDGAMAYHSGHKHDAMQKNGIGFDYIRKFSNEYGDFGSGALQMRLVWDDADDTPQVQAYNAYIKLKTSPVDVWAGHNRVPFGLAAYWDTHADLLQPLSMYGFGFERDWGAGISRDFADGDFSASVTMGSGMALKANGNLVAAMRASYARVIRRFVKGQL